ncbi:hypothetical protein PVV74_11680 [Roseovarius sp. SK2]|uniref:hypothetical protein n=1 Tax=Roseovarius TaxID=74030 RepID=UPI00237B40C7|nr:hypothetical protein [Roseovarius sp. SK2]MDD9726117.1 hypothetical protein [Roseovarius sp. SK2]
MTKQVLIRLPWPPPKTSANGSQGDFRGKAKAAKSYKATCALECMAQCVRPIEAEGNIPVRITYHPPTRGRVDWDNLANRAKQGWDAVAEAIGVDDGRWWPVVSEKGDPVKGGAVLVEVGAEGADNWRHVGGIVANMVRGSGK